MANTIVPRVKRDMREKLLSWRTWLTVWWPDLVLALAGLWVISGALARVSPGDGLYDFGSLLASGKAAQAGLNPYGIYPPLTFHATAPGLDTWNQNLNPPVSALLTQLFGLAEPHLMFRIWFAINILLYAVAVGLLLRRQSEAPRPVFAIFACSLAGFWETLALGQIHMPLVLAAVVAWLLLERGGTTWAGVLIGLIVAVKPNFAVWPALLLLAGYSRPAVISIVTTAVLSAIPAAVLGLQVYPQWFQVLDRPFESGHFLTNTSLFGFGARAGLPIVGIALSAAVLGAAALWAWMRRGKLSTTDVNSVALVVALLASPIAWVHYTIFLLPVLHAKWRLAGVRLAAAGLIIPIPFIVRQLGRDLDVQMTLGSVYGWAMLLLFFMLVRDELRRCGLLVAREQSAYQHGTAMADAR